MNENLTFKQNAAFVCHDISEKEKFQRHVSFVKTIIFYKMKKKYKK